MAKEKKVAGKKVPKVPSGPKTPKTPTLTLPVHDVYDALRSVIDGASKDETRPHLCGVFVRSRASTGTGRGTVEFMTTNAHVLCHWKQAVDDVPDREFTIQLDCAKRMVRELKDVVAEHRAAVKKWEYSGRWKKKDESDPAPEEPKLVFNVKSYRHDIGTMRLDLSKEPFPNVDPMLTAKMGGQVMSMGIATAYLALVAKQFKIAAKSGTSYAVRMEVQEGKSNLGMMKFSTDRLEAHLTVYVMPMRID